MQSIIAAKLHFILKSKHLFLLLNYVRFNGFTTILNSNVQYFKQRLCLIFEMPLNGEETLNDNDFECEVDLVGSLPLKAVCFIVIKSKRIKPNVNLFNFGNVQMKITQH